jgi:nucleotidyltransferase substrate binding protein (TIGR01987 family)
MDDVRWKQRFNNFLKAFQRLAAAAELAQERDLTDLEQQGLIQSFEFTHELAWNVLKDYLEYKGIAGLIGSRDTTREAFKKGLIEQGEAWMEMIAARNKTSHTYDSGIAQEVADAILEQFYPAFAGLAEKFTELNDQESRDT